jgi:hypothetical protein
MENDLTYFTRRASEERAAAAHAVSAKAQQAHLQLAQHYEARLFAVGGRVRGRA